MKVLSGSVGLAWPRDPGDFSGTVRAVQQAHRGARKLEVRLGVGPLRRYLPARVLGHAAIVAGMLQSDVIAIASPLWRLWLFSSAPKAGNHEIESAVRALGALAGALRLAGITSPIVLELADAAQEIPANLEVALPPKLIAWLDRAAALSGNTAPAIWYAREHAALSMFADVGGEDDLVLRITVGSAPEGKFWGVRWRVRAAALAHGLPVTPALALILKALRVPWYNATSAEPELAVVKSPTAAIAALDRAANPKYGGNFGLVPEARALRRIVNFAGVSELVDAMADAKSAERYVRQSGFVIAPRLDSALRRLL